MQNDTIAAIATPPGIGGIGVIRVSGAEAFAAVLPLLRRAKGRTELPPSHMLTYGHIIDPTSQEILDEVLVAFMSAPRTYTREDVVEIQGHGGPLVLQRILRLVLAQGVRMANPGELTMRAFLNGRIDLAQAEAVMDLINAQTEAGLRLAMQQFRGQAIRRTPSLDRFSTTASGYLACKFRTRATLSAGPANRHHRSTKCGEIQSIEYLIAQRSCHRIPLCRHNTGYSRGGGESAWHSTPSD